MRPFRKKKKQFFIKRATVDKKKVTSARKSVSFKEQTAVPFESSEEKTKVSHLPEEKLSPPAHDSPEAIQEGDGERAIRKSTRMAVIVRQAERDALRALQPASRPVKKKKGFEEERRMTQKEMLQEAAQTEFMNLQSLQRMLAREEEVKKRAVIRKSLYTGPQIRFHSVHGRNVLQFTEVNTLPAVINSKAPHYPERPVCVITGQPAKYRDPKTGLPYSTKEAFKRIRERLHKDDRPDLKEPLKDTHQRKRTEVEKELGGAGRPGIVKLRYKKSSRSQPSEGALATVVMEPRTTLSNDTSANKLVSESHFQATVSSPLVDQPLMSQRVLEHHSNTYAAEVPVPNSNIETNEADFLLEDLEVSLPSNLDSGLSLPSSGLSSYLLQNNSILGELDTDTINMEMDILSLPSAGTGFYQWDLK
ncbi:hypothetical protein O6H91_15G078800 [Diphasiastrum complanatum]|uniref:Uncharacterized protein n=1 Tax=Diphasiastrum complanatum TaxID=34168 RepID=A0ACC2BK07_DIPCM|nr:hypothetical protein O6H91_15G078800 [Diphasiastrum complanatum]